MGKQFVAVPFADLGAELGRSVFADPDLAHRQHDMRVRLRQPVGTDIPMDIEIGDHAPVDELGLYKITSELDALFLRHLARSEEHTSELQSLMRISYAVFCLKTKKKTSTLSEHPHSSPPTQAPPIN